MQVSPVFARIGKVGSLDEFCLGRSGEPIEAGKLYLSNDCRYAVAEVQNRGVFYFYQASQPTKYVHLRQRPLFDTAKQSYRLASLDAKQPPNTRWFGRLEVGDVIDGQHVAVLVSGPDQSGGVRRSAYVMLNPDNPARSRILYAVRRQLYFPPYLNHQRKLCFQEDGIEFALLGGGRIRKLGKPSTTRRRYSLDGTDEVDRVTGKRMKVVQTLGRSKAFAWYWGDHLFQTGFDRKCYWWNRKEQKLVEVSPVPLLLGQSADRNAVVLRSDDRKGVVRRHTLVKLNPSQP